MKLSMQINVGCIIIISTVLTRKLVLNPNDNMCVCVTAITDCFQFPAKYSITVDVFSSFGRLFHKLVQKLQTLVFCSVKRDNGFILSLVSDFPSRGTLTATCTTNLRACWT